MAINISATNAGCKVLIKEAGVFKLLHQTDVLDKINLGHTFTLEDYYGGDDNDSRYQSKLAGHEHFQLGNDHKYLPRGDSGIPALLAQRYERSNP